MAVTPADQIAQLQHIVNGHNATLENLTTRLTTLETNITMLTEILSGRNSRPKPSIPDTEKFSGSDTNWDTWFPSIKAKLRIDGAAIGNHEAQFFYVYGRLDTKVQALVMPQLTEAEDNDDYDPQTLIDQLKRLHDDPNKVQNAEDKFHSCRQQDNEGVAAFLMRFERLMYKAKANTWPDNTKISLLRKGLNKVTRTRLDTQVIVPKNYDDFVKLLQKLGNPGSGSYNSHSNGGQSNNHATPMDIGELASLDLAVKPIDGIAKPVPGREYLTLAELRELKDRMDREFINDLSE